MRRRTYSITDYDSTVAINFDSKAYVASTVDLGSIDASLASYQGAGQAGSTITARQLGTRDISISGHIIADSPEVMRSRKAALQKVVSPTSDFWLVVDGTHRILCTATATVEYPSEWYRNNEQLTSFTIDATCALPFFQTLGPQEASISGWVKDFHFPYVNPLGDKFTFGHKSESKIVDLVNESEVETGMLITFKAIGGSIVNPSLENVDTGERLRLGATMQAGEEVEIDTSYGSKSVRNVTAGKNWLQLFDLSSTWLQMPVGHSSFKYDFDAASTGTLECSVSYTPLLIEV